MVDSAIEIDGLSKKFRRGESHDSLRDLLPEISRTYLNRVRGEQHLRPEEFWALRDISAVINRGERVGIIGHNGAGKSTLLKHITGVLEPSRGQLRLKGRVSALIEVGAGFHPDLTGRENVFLNGVILGMKLAEVRRKFDEIVAFSELEEFIDTPVKRYSSGMYARLGFSVAAHLDPEILLIDEVLSVGDYTFQQKGLEKMRAIGDSGATVVFVSHNMKSVGDLCDRSLLLSKGTLTLDGPTPEVIAAYLNAPGQREGRSREGIVTESLVLRDEAGHRGSFATAATVWLEGALLFDLAQPPLELRVAVRDSSNRPVSAFSFVQAGQREAFRIEGTTRVSFRLRLALNVVSGPYTLRLTLHKVPTGELLCRAGPEISFVVSDQRCLSGVANLQPAIESFEVRS